MDVTFGFPAIEVAAGVLEVALWLGMYLNIWPGYFSGRGCMLFQVGLETGDLPGQGCYGKCN